MRDSKVLITGAGGFIGYHLVGFLKDRGYWVRGVDLKRPEFGETRADEFRTCDLRDEANCESVTEGIDEVYGLAADMGGMGFISANHVQILRNNLLINTHMLDAAERSGVKRYFFSSSACVYPEYRQEETDVLPLKEEDAYPAQPQDAYGWEKLVTERLCHHYDDETTMQTRVARFHNIYGPYGTWDGGREKVPAAFCRKVAQAKAKGERSIEIWGDGEQTRSFCHVDDCCEGIYRLMRSDHAEPLNIGQDRMVTINELADIVADAAGIEIQKVHVSGPQGVRGRNSDNTKLRQVLDWTPTIDLEEGIAETYGWVEAQVLQASAKSADEKVASV